MNDLLNIDETINTKNILLRYQIEKALIQAVVEGNDILASQQTKALLDKNIDYTDMEDRTIRDLNRSRKNMLLAFNTLLRLSACAANIPCIYIHALANHYAHDIERKELSLIFCQDYIMGMTETYCKVISSLKREQYNELTEKLINYIMPKINQNLTLDEISMHFNMNPIYLNRVFKKETGVPIMQYVKLQRIGLAKVLLRFNDKNISQISWAVGYNDSNYFNRVFKQVTGMSPNEYRKQENLADKLNA